MKSRVQFREGAFVTLLLVIVALAVVLEWRQGSLRPREFLAAAVLFAAALALPDYAARPPARSALPGLAGLLGSTHLMVHFSGRGDSALYAFYFIPILYSARLYGLKGSSVAGAIVTLLYATFFLHASLDEVLAELLEETVTLLFIALMAGFLVDRLRHESALRLAAEQTRRENERLAEIGMMAAQIAHDFRNPLQVIEGAAETFVGKGWIAGAGAPLLDDLRREARRMSDLVKDFLVFGRPVIRPAPNVRPAEICRHAATALKRARVTFAGDESLAMTADADALHRVFANLLINAEQADAEEIVVALVEESAGRISVEIADDGRGIQEEIRSTLFQPFRTTRPSGVGLGLAIARRLVDAHGGRLDLRPTDERRRTVFRIELPRNGAKP